MSALSKSYFTNTQKSDFNTTIKKLFLNAGFTDAFSSLAAAQAVHESGNYSNTAFIKFNNPFGYKHYSGSKWQKKDSQGNVSTEGDNYAAYDSIENATNELIDWWKRRASGGSYCKGGNAPVLSNIDTPKKYVDGLISCPDYIFFSNSSGGYPSQATIDDYVYSMSSWIQKIQFFYGKSTSNKAITIGVGIGLAALIGGYSYWFFKKRHTA